MTEPHSNDSDQKINVEQIESDVREAVEGSDDIRAEVERITRSALTEGRLDTAALKSIIQAVGRGASAGAGGHGERARHALAEALDGLDAAMARHAEGAKLSIEEALGKIEEFSQKDVRQALERLRGLESLMLDTLKEVADAGRVAGTDMLGSLVEHARRGGTALGEEVETTLRTVASRLPQTLQDTALAGLGAARETGARLAETASGFLAGVAEALRERDAKRSDKDAKERGG